MQPFYDGRGTRMLCVMRVLPCGQINILFPLTVRENILHAGIKLVRDIADGGEGEQPHEHGRHDGDGRHGQRVHQDRVVVPIVAAEGHHGAECHA